MEHVTSIVQEEGRFYLSCTCGNATMAWFLTHVEATRAGDEHIECQGPLELAVFKRLPGTLQVSLAPSTEEIAQQLDEMQFGEIGDFIVWDLHGHLGDAIAYSVGPDGARPL